MPRSPHRDSDPFPGDGTNPGSGKNPGLGKKKDAKSAPKRSKRKSGARSGKESQDSGSTIPGFPYDPIALTHDDVCVDFLSNEKNVPPLCSLFLPPTVFAKLEFSRLEIKKTRYMDNDARKKEADVLYKIPYRKARRKDKDYFIFVLVEHKTSFQATGFSQLRGYQQDLYRKIERKYGRPFPVYAYLLCQMGETQSNITSFFDVIKRDNAEAEPDLSAFAPELTEPKLLRMSDFLAKISKDSQYTSNFSVFYTILCNIADPNFGLTVPQLFKKLLLSPDDQELIRQLQLFITYLTKYADSFNEEELNSLDIFTFPEKETIKMATLAQKWLAQGDRQGFERGDRQGFERGIERGIERGTTESKIGSILRVLLKKYRFIPDDIRDAIRSTKDLELLDLLLDAAYESDSIDGFTQEMQRLIH